MNDDYKYWLNKMANYCAGSEKCSSDVLEKLKNSQLSDEEKHNIISYLTENNYINHERYAIAYANDKLRFNKWGRIKTATYLRHKDIENQHINTAIEQLDEKLYKEILHKLLSSKNKSLKETDSYKRKAKLINFALSKGFEFEEINTVLEKLQIN